MKIGVISEGHADRAVIENILVGLSGLDRSDIIAIRPSYSMDETDKAALAKTTSSYSIIKKECEEKSLINGFLAFEGQDFVVIHIDTAESDRYGVERPQKDGNPDYCELLRQSVVHQINQWLGCNMSDQIIYAVAIEETDAWLLALYDKGNDSTRAVNAKKKLSRLIERLGMRYDPNPFRHYSKLSKEFGKTRVMTNPELLARNCSLRLFCEEVQQKLLPKLDS